MSENQEKYDLAFLNKISGGDTNFIKEMINTFKEQVPEFIANAEKYFYNKDYEGVSKEAHRILPGVGFLGLKHIEGDLAKLEEFTKKQINLDEVGDLLTSSVDKMNEIIGIFNKEFDL
ncbi:MAG: Hpt domain-containing protein [Bacteroidales bacterium]|nr:Hpt domain-containing protein [Bacteroidales bacterium]MBN2819467.1 Hpt domain-containing protein [Bacteroidales bacterium]